MAELTPEEIMLLSAVLATQKLDTGNNMEDMCQQMQEDYLRIKEAFTEMNKSDISLSCASINLKGKR